MIYRWHDARAVRHVQTLPVRSSEQPAAFCIATVEAPPRPAWFFKLSDSAKGITDGAWILVAFKAFDGYDISSPVFDDYEALISAARGANFFSSLRAQPNITFDLFDKSRRLSRLSRAEASLCISELEKLRFLDVLGPLDESADVAVSIIRVLDADKTSAYRAASGLFASRASTPQARAALAILQLTSTLPLPKGYLIAEVGRRFSIDTSAPEAALKVLIACGVIQETTETESGEHLLINPAVFQDPSIESFKLLDNLSKSERDMALSILGHVTENPGMPFTPLHERRIVDVLVKAGLIDLSGIRVAAGGVSKEFPTTPSAWGILSLTGFSAPVGNDVIDDAKVLFNSFRYGELYSRPARGRITQPIVLVRALINRGQIGEATAIGEDYPLPLARGIIGVTESRLKPGQFYMELRKRDVAEAVLDVLSDHVIVGPASQQILGRPDGEAFDAPEVLRAKRAVPTGLESMVEGIAFSLRTMRNGK